MNGLRQYRETQKAETNEKRFKEIEQKLDEILTLLKPIKTDLKAEPKPKAPKED